MIEDSRIDDKKEFYQIFIERIGAPVETTTGVEG